MASTTRKLARGTVLLGAACIPLAGARIAAAQITIQTVPIGNAGNAPDYNPNNGNYYGQVNYNYNIGEYDVTASQYAVFLNSVAASDPYGLYNSAMSQANNGYPGIVQSGSSGSYTYSVVSGRANNPVSDVTYWDATRFANWMDNGQPVGSEGAGTTETGSYTLTTAGINSGNVPRNSNAVWAVPTENEWYKAAYYTTSYIDPGYSDNGQPGYYPYPTGSEIDPTKANYAPPTGSQVAPPGTGYDTTPVGSFAAYPSAYGTYDQGGDVFQWTEPNAGTGYSDIHGGAFNSWDYGATHSTEYYTEAPYWSSQNTGFRLTEIGTPASTSNTSNTSTITDVGKTGLILRNYPGGISAVMAQLLSGYNNGAWNGTTGILSSAAAADSSHLTCVGAVINDSRENYAGYNSGYVWTTNWFGNSTVDDDILLRYTYYGDANLDGVVDGSDYTLIDNGYTNNLTGWYNGDFNYDGIVNGSDYTLIDNSYNTQGGALNDQIAVNNTEEIAPAVTLTAVPEPASLGLLGMTALALLSRRRKYKQS